MYLISPWPGLAASTAGNSSKETVFEIIRSRFSFPLEINSAALPWVYGFIYEPIIFNPLINMS